MTSRTVELDTTGMHCRSCAMMIEMSIKEVEGVADARVDLDTATTTVTFDQDLVSPDTIVEAVVKAGYGASVRS